MRKTKREQLQQILMAASLLLAQTYATAEQSARDNGPQPSEDEYKACEGRNEGDVFQRLEEKGAPLWSACFFNRGKLAAQPAHRHGTKPTKTRQSPMPANSGGQGAPKN